MTNRRLRLLAATAATLAGCGEDVTEQQSPMPPTTTIRMELTRFDPQGSTVEVGKQLTWINFDDVPHDVDFQSGAIFESDPVGKGGRIRYTPRKSGQINYVCSVHPGMAGVLSVE